MFGNVWYAEMGKNDLFAILHSRRRKKEEKTVTFCQENPQPPYKNISIM